MVFLSCPNNPPPPPLLKSPPVPKRTFWPVVGLVAPKLPWPWPEGRLEAPKLDSWLCFEDGVAPKLKIPWLWPEGVDPKASPWLCPDEGLAVPKLKGVWVWPEGMLVDPKLNPWLGPDDGWLVPAKFNNPWLWGAPSRVEDALPKSGLSAKLYFVRGEKRI